MDPPIPLPPLTPRWKKKSTLFHSIYEKTAALGQALTKIIIYKFIHEF